MAWAAFLPEIAGAATEAAAGTAEGAAAGAVDATAGATSESTASRMNNFAQGSADHNKQDDSKKRISLTVSDVTSDVM